MTHPDEHLLRDLTPQVLGAIVRRYGDFASSEDAVQEALLAAATQWPKTGLPDNPRGWLIQVAARRMIDAIRQDESRRKRETIVMSDAADQPWAPAADKGEAMDQDDTLLLLFMSCHPSLTPSSAIALTLRAVGGLTTAEIARAFLVPEATMAQRISRAKQTIKASGVPFEVPERGEREQRLDAVLHVLYLMFNEGYTSSSGPVLQRTDLASEAIRLTRAVQPLAPDDAEVSGLLALMLLTDARRLARTGSGGELIPLDEQDRSRWDRSLIAEGTEMVTATIAKGSLGAYQLQAAIAALHDEAASIETTDWPQVLALYGLLKRMDSSPMVALNYAIAAAMVHGPASGLTLLDALDQDERIAGHYRLDAVRAHLLERAGERDSAIERYRAAAQRTTSIPERDYLIGKAARLAAMTSRRAQPD